MCEISCCCKSVEHYYIRGPPNSVPLYLSATLCLDENKKKHCTCHQNGSGCGSKVSHFLVHFVFFEKRVFRVCRQYSRFEQACFESPVQAITVRKSCFPSMRRGQEFPGSAIPKYCTVCKLTTSLFQPVWQAQRIRSSAILECCAVCNWTSSLFQLVWQEQEIRSSAIPNRGGGPGAEDFLQHPHGVPRECSGSVPGLFRSVPAWRHPSSSL